MAHIDVRNLWVVYRLPRHDDDLVAVEDFTLALAGRPGEFVSIIGPSGCGKSTLLLAMDGLVQPASGDLLIDGRPVAGPGPDRAVVFQEVALLPWRTVLDNVCFGMEFRGVAAAERQEVARRYVKLVGLSGFERHYPHQLSGGMRQRVGIARALAVHPAILLMDEPFGALDAQTRQLMGVELLRIWDQERKTVVFVTHDLDEAIFLSDRVVVMTARPGRVKAVIPIELPRPRDQGVRNTLAFIDYRRQLWGLLEEEAMKSLDLVEP
ncbi:MAG: ABC transporter ATP-binding protein [Deltaproteobacteria bacterium]|nr:ABC transporter ATP-binding protein [Deltaproteobacteria bacterium]MBI3079541.1 ABC transporter ATP-binding protein [Deltaproteobacteria bacterium]